MKKFLVIMLVLCGAFGLAACNSKKPTTEGTTTTETTTNDGTTTTEGATTTQTTTTESAKKLAAPANVTVSENGIVNFDAVENASSYVVVINGVSYDTNTNSYTLNVEGLEGCYLEVSVKAKGDLVKYTDSDFTDSIIEQLAGDITTDEFIAFLLLNEVADEALGAKYAELCAESYVSKKECKEIIEAINNLTGETGDYTVALEKIGSLNASNENVAFLLVNAALESCVANDLMDSNTLAYFTENKEDAMVGFSEVLRILKTLYQEDVLDTVNSIYATLSSGEFTADEVKEIKAIAQNLVDQLAPNEEAILKLSALATGYFEQIIETALEETAVNEYKAYILLTQSFKSLTQIENLLDAVLESLTDEIIEGALETTFADIKVVSYGFDFALNLLNNEKFALASDYILTNEYSLLKDLVLLQINPGEEEVVALYSQVFDVIYATITAESVCEGKDFTFKVMTALLENEYLRSEEFLSTYYANISGGDVTYLQVTKVMDRFLVEAISSVLSVVEADEAGKAFDLVKTLATNLIDSELFTAEDLDLLNGIIAMIDNGKEPILETILPEVKALFVDFNDAIDYEAYMAAEDEYELYAIIRGAFSDIGFSSTSDAKVIKIAEDIASTNLVTKDAVLEILDSFFYNFSEEYLNVERISRCLYQITYASERYFSNNTEITSVTVQTLVDGDLFNEDFKESEAYAFIATEFVDFTVYNVATPEDLCILVINFSTDRTDNTLKTNSGYKFSFELNNGFYLFEYLGRE